MKAFRCCSDGAPPPRKHKNPKIKVIDVACPQCGAKPGVGCCGSGTHHVLRAHAWRQEVHAKSKRRKLDQQRRARARQVSHGESTDG